jgi:hypothetical protein
MPRSTPATSALWAAALITLAGVACAAPGYDPRETFAPITLPDAPGVYRSAGGAPGPDYWQNRADYQIHADLDPAAKTLTGEETITYANNSPDTLDCLWLQLDQNIYRRDARSVLSSDWPRHDFTDGFVLDEVSLVTDGKAAPAAHLVSDTRLQVRLAAPLVHGGKVKLHVRWHYAVPGAWGGRTSWVDTPRGPIFDIAQWYPRMAVYDDVRGWDTSPYLVQEFYLEYGDFDYSVTVPSDMVVAGTGELANPAEVLTAGQRDRLAAARASDKPVMIRTAEDVAAAPPAKGSLTWRFHMADTRDVVFSASRAFVWDAARINLPGGKTALAQSFYPPEVGGADAWGRSTEYLKDSVEHFSQRWAPYPYPNAFSVAGGTSGMEYPGMAFDGLDDKGKALFWITAHEIGHTWFPMMVGFDERRHAWMDEGFNTFIDTFESDEFEGGVYGPKRDSEFAPGGGLPADEIESVLSDPAAPPILTRADLISEKYRHPVTYFKSAYGLVLLREVILGPERFDLAFRKFIADWAFKHPKPSDFFRTMESEGGEDLSWFWQGWYFENWNIDMAVEGVAYVGGDPAKGAKVTIANLDKLVLPTTLEVVYADGKTVDVAVPVETWMLRSRAEVALPGGPSIVSATLDPRHLIPDKDRSNNRWQADVKHEQPSSAVFTNGSGVSH